MDEILWGHSHGIQKCFEDILYILYGILLPKLKYCPLVNCHDLIHFFQQDRELSEHVVSALNTAFLPDPSVLIGVGLNLGTVNISVFQIHVQFAEYVAVDVVEDLLQTAGKLLVNEIADGHMAGRFFLVQHPNESDIRFAKLFDETDRAKSKLHEGKQYNL